MSHKGKNSANSAKGKKPAKSGAEGKGDDALQAVVRSFTAGHQRLADANEIC